MRLEKIKTYICLIVASLTLLLGCKSEEKKNPFKTPPPTFTGPIPYRGAVRSVASLRKNKPILVSGFGMVVDLDGTGSGDVPGSMRPKLLDDLRKRGLGLRRYNSQNLSPERFLDSPDTALVIVQGIIPAGAVEGSRFDLLVTAHPTTDTKSLRNGRLWTTDLGVNGANRSMAAVTTRARGSGNIYLNPMVDSELKKLKDHRLQNRIGYVLGGGVVKEERVLWLSMNMPSWKWSGAIADLINERFKKDPDAIYGTANAKNDTGIDIRVPQKYAHDIDHFLGLIRHLFLNRSHGFVRAKAVELVYELEKNPSELTNVKLSWEAMGVKVLPVIQNLYGPTIDVAMVPQAGVNAQSDDLKIERKTNLLHVRKAALEVGARLGDKLALPHLLEFAQNEQSSLRMESARWLPFYAGNFKATRALRKLLFDENDQVKVKAYEGLAINRDISVITRPIGDEERTKFVMDVVNVPYSTFDLEEKQSPPKLDPLVYINQHPKSHMPRVTVFNRVATFQFPLMSRHLENQLTVLARTFEEPMQVLYQDSSRIAVAPWRDVLGKDSRYRALAATEEEFHGRLIDFFNPNQNKSRMLNQLDNKTVIKKIEKIDMSLPELDTQDDRFFYGLKQWPIVTYSRRKSQLEDLYEKIVYIRGKKARAKVAGQWREVIIPSAIRPSVGEEMIPPTIPDYVVLMGNNPTFINRIPGFNRTFSEVAETLYQMKLSGDLDADFKVAPQSIVARIKQLEEREGNLNQGERRDGDYVDLEAEEATDEDGLPKGEMLPTFPEATPTVPDSRQSAQFNNAPLSDAASNTPRQNQRMQGGR